MIFLTVGWQLPFDRLVSAVDAWAAGHPEQEIFGQILNRGAHCYVPRHFEHVAQLPPGAFAEKCQRATLLVGHAGTGTLITAMTYQKPLVMMPRRAKLGEHRNDHQLATASRFADISGVTVVEDSAELAAALDHAINTEMIGVHAPPEADADLIATIRTVIIQR